MWNDEIKKDARVIETGLKGNKAYELLSGIEGQLSDGYWENSRAMEGYWKFFYIEKLPNDNVAIVISKKYHEHDYWGRFTSNRFIGKSDEQIKNWFADKIKYIVKLEGLDWKRNNEQLISYLSYDEDISVKESYKVYDTLKGRC